jgi:FlaA1/EpsC-like NDP-sugar epimerase
MFANKTLLITGGTGSFGQKMVDCFINNTEYWTTSGIFTG